MKSIAWFRTPKLDQWTALPDIGHDLLGSRLMENPIVHIPGTSFTINTHILPNAMLLVLLVATCVFISLHPLRATITRRLLFIYSMLLISRAIMAVVTYLPDSNPECHRHKVGLGADWEALDVREVVRRMLLTLVPALVSESPIENVPSGCRDTIYNGHTVMLVLCAMTWHTYYKWVPSYVNQVKALIWASVIGVILLSLAQRHNYTLDVVLSTYFSITEWATYHRLANDVITGHSFSSVWLIDKVIVYPIMEWMEACVDVEASGNYRHYIYKASPKHTTARASASTPSLGKVRLYRLDSGEFQPNANRSTFRTSEW